MAAKTKKQKPLKLPAPPSEPVEVTIDLREQDTRNVIKNGVELARVLVYDTDGRRVALHLRAESSTGSGAGPIFLRLSATNRQKDFSVKILARPWVETCAVCRSEVPCGCPETKNHKASPEDIAVAYLVERHEIDADDARDLLAWLNSADPSRAVLDAAAELAKDDRFTKAWDCPTCGDRCYEGTPRSQAEEASALFSGTLERDFTSYPGKGPDDKRCDHCRCYMAGEDDES